MFFKMLCDNWKILRNMIRVYVEYIYNKNLKDYIFNKICFIIWFCKKIKIKKDIKDKVFGKNG